MCKMAFIAALYSEILCIAALWYSKMNPYILIFFVCLYSGAGAISVRNKNSGRFSAPLIYSYPMVNIALTIANVASLVVFVLLLIVNWKIFLISLLFVIFLGRNFLAFLAEAFIVWPVAFFKK